MEDKEIIQLFFERNEEALSAVSQKYGRYCEIIAKNIIGDASDAEECFNDTLLDVWDSIPPNKPDNLRVYMGKITKNNALNKIKSDSAQKRGGSELKVVMDELEDFSSDYSVEEVAGRHEIIAEINCFLRRLTESKRKTLVLRYWYCCEVSEIAAITGLTEANVYNVIKRERKKLLEYLRKRGVLD